MPLLWSLKKETRRPAGLPQMALEGIPHDKNRMNVANEKTEEHNKRIKKDGNKISGFLFLN